MCIPLFIVGYGITLFNFDIIWRYFAWSNQTLSVFVLWSIYVWLARRKKNIWVALIPAIAMTFIVTSFVFVSPQFIGMEDRMIAFACAAVVTLGIGYLVNRRVKGDVIMTEEAV